LPCLLQPSSRLPGEPGRGLLLLGLLTDRSGAGPAALPVVVIGPDHVVVGTEVALLGLLGMCSVVGVALDGSGAGPAALPVVVIGPDHVVIRAEVALLNLPSGAGMGVDDLLFVVSHEKVDRAVLGSDGGEGLVARRLEEAAEVVLELLEIFSSDLEHLVGADIGEECVGVLVLAQCSLEDGVDLDIADAGSEGDVESALSLLVEHRGGRIAEVSDVVDHDASCRGRVVGGEIGK